MPVDDFLAYLCHSEAETFHVGNSLWPLFSKVGGVGITIAVKAGATVIVTVEAEERIYICRQRNRHISAYVVEGQLQCRS